MILPPRFACDVMLGRTARWLRLLGFDTYYDNKAEDEDLRELCLGEHRVLLTKDGALHASMPPGTSHCVSAVGPRRQLQEIAAACALARFPLPSRCSLCNGRLDTVGREEVAGRVPPYVFATQVSFQRCRLCRKIYWPGTHAAGISRLIVAIRRSCG